MGHGSQILASSIPLDPRVEVLDVRVHTLERRMPHACGDQKGQGKNPYTKNRDGQEVIREPVEPCKRVRQRTEGTAGDNHGNTRGYLVRKEAQVLVVAADISRPARDERVRTRIEACQ